MEEESRPLPGCRGEGGGGGCPAETPHAQRRAHRLACVCTAPFSGRVDPTWGMPAAPSAGFASPQLCKPLPPSTSSPGASGPVWARGLGKGAPSCPARGTRLVLIALCPVGVRSLVSRLSRHTSVSSPRSLSASDLGPGTSGGLSQLLPCPASGAGVPGPLSCCGHSGSWAPAPAWAQHDSRPHLRPRGPVQRQLLPSRVRGAVL